MVGALDVVASMRLITGSQIARVRVSSHVEQRVNYPGERVQAKLEGLVAGPHEAIRSRDAA